MARLRTIDLAAVGTAEPEVPVADGFTYVVAMDAATASASDGVEGPQAELLAAAGAVVDSCIQSMGSPAS